jgi:3-phenylpropionate/trans-cinnamate dioxygenase ferredoxin reductase subunit
MTGEPLVIVGGGPAGLSAARSFREHDQQTPVVLLSADQHPPYARPPLTKDYLRGESTAEELPLESLSWYDEHQVDLRLDTRVEAVDPATRSVRLADGESLVYRDLILATGSSPKPLPVPGGDDPDLIYVRDRHSGERLRALTQGPAQRIAVIGSGFIGCEVAASLAAVDREVVLLTGETVPHEARLGTWAGGQIGRWLTDAGVQLRTGAAVSAIIHEGRRWLVALEDGSSLVADAVVCGGGAAPNLGLAESAGLALEEGGVPTDASLRTADPHIFAVGDIAYALNTAAGRRLRVEHWGEAETHGEIAGAVAAGVPRTWDNAPGFWSELGERALKYSAWGDGNDAAVPTGSADSWAVFYGSGERLVGVLTYQDDEAYEDGQRSIERGATLAEATAGRTRPD